MCPSAPRVCNEPGGQKPVLSLSLDRIVQSVVILFWREIFNVKLWMTHFITSSGVKFTILTPQLCTCTHHLLHFPWCHSSSLQKMCALVLSSGNGTIQLLEFNCHFILLNPLSLCAHATFKLMCGDPRSVINNGHYLKMNCRGGNADRTVMKYPKVKVIIIHGCCLFLSVIMNIYIWNYTADNDGEKYEY